MPDEKIPIHPPARVTAYEFEKSYAQRSGITIDRLRELGRIVEPCLNCDHAECQGWKSVNAKEYHEDLLAFLEGIGPHP